MFLHVQIDSYFTHPLIFFRAALCAKIKGIKVVILSLYIVSRKKGNKINLKAAIDFVAINIFNGTLSKVFVTSNFQKR